MLLLLSFLLGAPAQERAATRLSLYVYSLDSEAGFHDEELDVFRRELARHVDTFTEVAYSREEADVSIQHLGQGELTVELQGDGTAEGYLFRPDDGAARMWALVHVAGYSRAFSVEGDGGRKMSELGKQVGDWIRDRSSTIRERSRS